MKTGMARAIDTLGRIVIPKEMRRSLGLDEGSEVEFYINENGDISLAPVRSDDDIQRMVKEVVGNGYIVRKA